MKNGKLKILVIVVISLFIICLLPIRLSNPKKNKVVTFAVLSDVHIKNIETESDINFRNALKIVQNRTSNLDAIFVAGDLTQYGMEIEYKRFKEIYSSEAENIPLYTVMGNHDLLNKKSKDPAELLYVKEFNEKLKSHDVINGIHFIRVSGTTDKVNGYYPPETLEWLDKEIASAVEDSNEGSPVFVITHHPPQNTVYGSTSFGNTELDSVLKKYPQVINFAGHSHYTLDDERSIYQENYTIVNTSSVSFQGTEINGRIEKIMDLSGGLIVNMYSDNTVTIEKMDFTNNKPIKEKWIIKEPTNKEKYVYTKNRKDTVAKPCFDEESKISVEDITDVSAKVKFTKSNYQETINCYVIKLINKQTSIVENTYYVSGKSFYGDNAPKEFECSITNLQPNSNYEVQVYAQESFGNLSENYLKEEFKTKEKEVEQIDENNTNQENINQEAVQE